MYQFLTQEYHLSDAELAVRMNNFYKHDNPDGKDNTEAFRLWFYRLRQGSIAKTTLKKIILLARALDYENARDFNLTKIAKMRAKNRWPFADTPVMRNIGAITSKLHAVITESDEGFGLKYLHNDFIPFLLTQKKKPRYIPFFLSPGDSLRNMDLFDLSIDLAETLSKVNKKAAEGEWAAERIHSILNKVDNSYFISAFSQYINFIKINLVSDFYPVKDISNRGDFNDPCDEHCEEIEESLLLLFMWLSHQFKFFYTNSDNLKSLINSISNFNKK